MKSFIPRQYKREPVTIRMDSKRLAVIDSISVSTGLSRSELINQCIDFAFENMEDSQYKVNEDEESVAPAVTNKTKK